MDGGFFLGLEQQTNRSGQVSWEARLFKSQVRICSKRVKIQVKGLLAGVAEVHRTVRDRASATYLEYVEAGGWFGANFGMEMGNWGVGEGMQDGEDWLSWNMAIGLGVGSGRGGAIR